MKRLVIVAVASVAIAAVLVNRPSGAMKETAPSQASVTHLPRLPSKDAPFWNSAVVPEPADFREAAVVESPAREVFPADHRSEVARAINDGDEKALNFAAAAWFEEDPVAVRDWLAMQESLDPLQSSLAMIAGRIASAGDPAHGLEWAGTLKPGPEREQLIFDIYSLAARGRQFTDAELREAPLPPERIELLLSGAAGD